MKHRLLKHRESERGTVTAEVAVTLPAIIVVLALLLFGASAGAQQIRVESAARAASRTISRGDSAQQAQEIAKQLAGADSIVSIAPDGEFITVTVSSGLQGPWGEVLKLNAHSSARAEHVP